MIASRLTSVIPSILEKAFNCPHCGALAKQFWYDLYAFELPDSRVPIRFTPSQAKSFGDDIEDLEVREKMVEWAIKISTKVPFLDGEERSRYVDGVSNLSLSKCFNCQQVSVWIADELVCPKMVTVPPPNIDLPEEARRDYLEAASIAGSSPRGAAALLRLAVQRICIELGGDGKNLNSDISRLVKNGLDVRIQQALDLVRVVGNNAVHPGELDVDDNSDVANKLFAIVNLIVDVLISQPKHIALLYGDLPSDARAAVDARDA